MYLDYTGGGLYAESQLSAPMALPTITDCLTIDGRTQAQYDETAPAPVIQMDGSRAVGTTDAGSSGDRRPWFSRDRGVCHRACLTVMRCQTSPHHRQPGASASGLGAGWGGAQHRGQGACAGIRECGARGRSAGHSRHHGVWYI